MKTIELKKASSPLADYVKNLQEGVLIVTKNGRLAAALVPFSANVDLEAFGLGTNPEFIELLEESRRQLKAGGRSSLAEVKKEFGIK
jgi:antitoxin (DNA-binding transcriptional repressor) of toxin-antitoxin stability system